MSSIANQASLGSETQYAEFKLTDLNCESYIIVGDGAYVEQLLALIDINNVRKPEYILVNQYNPSIQIEGVKQIIDDGARPIEANRLVLGTGSFQLEMLQRLKPRCSEKATFADVCLFKPKYCFWGKPDASRYIIYVDQYANINIENYLKQFFSFVAELDIKISIHHPMESLDDDYVINAEAVLLWNGSSPSFRRIKQQCEDYRVTVTYAECGFFPQADHFYFDKHGVNASSQLSTDDLSWVTGTDVDLVHAKRIKVQQQHALAQRYVFVPLQVPTDTNIIYHSRFTTGMQSFIDFIEAKYPSKRVLFKAHPKDVNKTQYRFQHGELVNQDVYQLIAGAECVHGINSSVLYESALMGKPTFVEGESLLKQHQHQVDTLLAAIIARQYSISQSRFDAQQIKQFSFLHDLIFQESLYA